MTRRILAARFPCPACQSSDTHCVNSRNEPSGGRRRRYKCKACGAGFSSLEMLLDEDAGVRSTADRFKRQFLLNLTIAELFGELGQRLTDKASN